MTSAQQVVDELNEETEAWLRPTPRQAGRLPLLPQRKPRAGRQEITMLGDSVKPLGLEKLLESAVKTDKEHKGRPLKSQGL